MGSFLEIAQVFFLPCHEPYSVKPKEIGFLSFFSGETSFAFAIAKSKTLNNKT